MLNDEFFTRIFENNQENVEKRISEKYHKRIKQIKEKNIEERENIKQGIIAELYYKEGFKDGINYIINYIKKL